MTKQFFIMLTLVFASLLTACKGGVKRENTADSTAKVSIASSDDIVTQSLVDEQGERLELIFDNAKDLVTIHFRGDTAALPSQKPASGIWYENDRYELRGKGKQITLIKDGETVFKN